MEKKVNQVGDLPHDAKGVKNGAWQSVVRAAQGNFDHLMGLIRRIVKAHNSLVDDVDDLRKWAQDAIDDTPTADHTHDGSDNGGGTLTVDHGSLTGLGDDDHPQYMTPAEHDAVGDSTPHHAKNHNIWSTDHPDVDTADTRADGDVLTWDATASKWKASTGGGGAGTKHASYIWMSRPRVETGVGRKFFADRDGTIDLVFAWATDEAPTGTMTLDLLKNGVSIFNTKPTITAGNFLGGEITSFASASFVKGDKFEPEIEALGGVTKGRIGLLIRFTYT